MSAGSILNYTFAMFFASALLLDPEVEAGKIVVDVDPKPTFELDYAVRLFTSDGELCDQNISFKYGTGEGVYVAKDVPEGSYWMTLKRSIGTPSDIDAVKIDVGTNIVHHVFHPESDIVKLQLELSPKYTDEDAYVYIRRITEGEIEPVFVRCVWLEKQENGPAGRYVGDSWGPMPAGQYLLSVNCWDDHYESGIGSLCVTVPENMEGKILRLTIGAEVLEDDAKKE